MHALLSLLCALNVPSVSLSVLSLSLSLSLSALTHTTTLLPLLPLLSLLPTLSVRLLQLLPPLLPPLLQLQVTLLTSRADAATSDTDTPRHRLLRWRRAPLPPPAQFTVRSDGERSSWSGEGCSVCPQLTSLPSLTPSLPPSSSRSLSLSRTPSLPLAPSLSKTRCEVMLGSMPYVVDSLGNAGTTTTL